MIPAMLRLVRARPWPAGGVEVPKTQAHRGLWSAGFQENTLPAFRAAKAAGFRMAELDVLLDRGDEPVVIHDEDLRRLAGSPGRTRDLSADELHRRANAPTLREVLRDGHGVDAFNIEIKAPVSVAGRIENAVAAVIREARAEDRVMISSFNPFSLVLMANLLPEVPRALLATTVKEPGNSLFLRRLWLAPLLDVHMLNLDDRMMTPELISFLRERRIPVSVWTVNDVQRARELLDAGVVSVITDRVKPADVAG